MYLLLNLSYALWFDFDFLTYALCVENTKIRSIKWYSIRLYVRTIMRKENKIKEINLVFYA